MFTDFDLNCQTPTNATVGCILNQPPPSLQFVQVILPEDLLCDSHQRISCTDFLIIGNSWFVGKKQTGMLSHVVTYLIWKLSLQLFIIFDKSEHKKPVLF